MKFIHTLNALERRNIKLIIENIFNFKINKLTQAQYERELKADNIDANQLYLTPYEEVVINDQTPTFTQSIIRDNIISGEKICIIFGKIAKWFSDLKAVAFSGSYNDLQDKPKIPNIKTVEDSTETTLSELKITKFDSQEEYEAATLEENGLYAFPEPVDEELSTTSTNPVQNAVVTSVLKPIANRYEIIDLGCLPNTTTSVSLTLNNVYLVTIQNTYNESVVYIVDTGSDASSLSLTPLLTSTYFTLSATGKNTFNVVAGSAIGHLHAYRLIQ